MPIKFGITQEDMKRSTTVTPGWYLCTINSIVAGPGKNDPQSTTITIDMVIKDGAVKEFIGVPLRYWLSEKAAGLATTFLEAAFRKKLPKEGAQIPDLEPLKGQDIKVYVKNEKYRNRMGNVCEDFAPAA